MPNCAFRHQVFQAGAPVKTTYVDGLGRTIASGVEGFYGHEVIVKTEYNERGLKITDYPPFETSVGPGDWDGSVSPYPTRYSGFDALGRAATKTVVRNPLVFDPGAGDATIATHYQYKAVDTNTQTCITVAKARSRGGSLTMSRS